MKTIYLDCGMGAAGDMLTAALLELTADPVSFVKRLNSLGIPKVTHHHEHHHHEHHHHDHDHGHHSHTGLHEIEHIVSHLEVSEKVKKDILAVYTLIAEAESHVHGRPVSEIHFHEVGTIDAVADVAAVCMLMEELSPDKVIASPVHVGSGSVRCAHGILPVPAPATAYFLRDIPIYGGSTDGELCTPTGAALLKYFVGSFGEMPVMRPSAIGYGMGRKDFGSGLPLAQEGMRPGAGAGRRRCGGYQGRRAGGL